MVVGADVQKTILKTKFLFVSFKTINQSVVVVI